MCGIAGFIDSKLSKEEQDPLLEKMLQSIAHRGPDARGKYFDGAVGLGHNRLSIIDLSVDGNQPMFRGRNAIVYNGEVYNYKEIRKTLEATGVAFKTSSDTEVILAAYEKYGFDCVQHFVGMWSFALWDEEKQLLFCSRDRFGIKPFFYLSQGDRFYFGSEYKALKFSDLFSNSLNYNQIARGLQLGWCTYKSETYYSCISQLEAGCNLVYKNGKIDITKYWEIESQRYNYTDHNEAVFDFRELLRDSVKIHLRSDVEVAICLSGGIDSSSLTGLIGDVYPDLKFHSFSIYYDGKGEVDERPFINAVTNKFPNVMPHFYKPDNNVIPDFFENVVENADVPITGSSPISHYYLVEQIKKSGIKVVLDGQGADEYLGGYIPAYYRQIADLMSSASLVNSTRKLNRIAKDQEHSFSDRIKYAGKSVLSIIKGEQELYDLELRKYFPFLVREELLNNKILELKKFGVSRLDNYLYHSMYETSLPTILHYVDRMTMSHSVESRVPFLDHRLIDFAFSLPSEEKIKISQTKSILRESVKDLLPEKVYLRKDKKGFVTPGEDKWLRGNLSWLLDLDYANLDYLETSKLKNIVSEYRKGNNQNAKLIWRVALLNYWMKKNS